MTVEEVPQEKPQHRRPFSASESPHRETDTVTPRLKNSLIEKCLKQLVKKELFGRPYVKDYLYGLKRRNCHRGGDPRIKEASYRFYVVRGAMAEYLRRNQKHEHEDEEKIEAPGSRWGTWDRTYRATETMCRMVEARGLTPMARAA